MALVTCVGIVVIVIGAGRTCLWQWEGGYVSSSGAHVGLREVLRERWLLRQRVDGAFTSMALIKNRSIQTHLNNVEISIQAHQAVGGRYISSLGAHVGLREVLRERWLLRQRVDQHFVEPRVERVVLFRGLRFHARV